MAVRSKAEPWNEGIPRSRFVLGSFRPFNFLHPKDFFDHSLGLYSCEPLL